MWALLSPIFALAMRAAYIASTEGFLYCLISFTFSLIAFSGFRVHDGIARFFTVNDAWNVVKAVACGELMTCILLFTFTRLDNIPRSLPLIHALILCAGLIAVRAAARLRETDNNASNYRRCSGTEHIVMIGSTDLTVLFVKLLAAFCPARMRVVAVLDGRPHMIGRTIAGIRIVGAPNDLQPIVDEFAVHGVNIDRVVIGGDETLLTEDALDEVRRFCGLRSIPLTFVRSMVGLSGLNARDDADSEPQVELCPAIRLPPYFRWKYAIDLVVAAIALLAAAPLLIVTAGLALLDVGFPLVFWQQRSGLRGRPIVVYKIRTLQPPFDRLGRTIPDDQRLSRIGTFLRRMRLDELPQLFNVLVGDMSLVGPRPLLTQDQPPNPTARLMVRPGITGWAQVNGGTLLTPSEKDELDEWYVRNASLWLDLRILAMTVQFLIGGQRRTNVAKKTDHTHSVNTGTGSLGLARQAVESRHSQIG